MKMGDLVCIHIMYNTEVFSFGGNEGVVSRGGCVYMFTPCFCSVKPETRLSSGLQIECVLARGLQQMAINSRNYAVLKFRHTLQCLSPFTVGATQIKQPLKLIPSHCACCRGRETESRRFGSVWGVETH